MIREGLWEQRVAGKNESEIRIEMLRAGKIKKPKRIGYWLDDAVAVESRVC